jgi:hypothetical protein
MVKAILDGRKTMTRRVIKMVPSIMEPTSEVDPLPCLVDAYKNAWIKTCPYGQPGDRLFITQGASFDKTVPFEKRFWSRVYKFESCWEWFGNTNRKGYGIIRQNGISIATQRASWRLHNGAIPNGMHVLHTCDMPWCVNPAHLYLGKNEDNIRDKVMRGRTAKSIGAKNGQAKLTETDIAQIRVLYWEQNIYQHQIATQFNISQPEVSRIVHDKRWNSIPNPRPLIGHRWLEITAVRVERIQDITEEDAKAEGIVVWEGDRLQRGNSGGQQDFSKLWDSLNAKRGYGWDVNPWVWVISFRRTP